MSAGKEGRVTHLPAHITVAPPQHSPAATFLISVTFLFFTQHCREGTRVKIWALDGLVRGKSYFIFAKAQVLCVHVCVWIGEIYDGGFLVVLAQPLI